MIAPRPAPRFQPGTTLRVLSLQFAHGRVSTCECQAFLDELGHYSATGQIRDDLPEVIKGCVRGDPSNERQARRLRADSEPVL